VQGTAEASRIFHLPRSSIFDSHGFSEIRIRLGWKTRALALPSFPVIFRALILSSILATCAFAQRSAPAPAAPSQPAPKPSEVDTTAIGALNLLGKEAAAQVARIEARDGHPFPDRWYILVHDAAQPRGLREFVFSGGKLVGGRTLSQFADSITADEVIGASAIKVNSDQAAGVAAQFAVFNNARLGTVQYELFKSSTPPAPVWRLTCHGSDGESLGTILLHATKGSLLGFQGFAKSPIVPETIVATEPPPTKPAEPAAPTADRSKRPATNAAASSSTTVAAKPAPPKANPVRREPEPARAVPVRPAPRQGPVDRIGNVFRRVFRD
jgi:hypothetical protein